MVTGTLFTIAFVLSRLATIPHLIFAIYTARAGLFAPAPTTPGWFGPVFLSIEAVLVPLPMVFNAYWGAQVVTGYAGAMRKAMRRGRGKGSKAA